MSLVQRLRRVEGAHQERMFRQEAGRLAERYGLNVDDVLRTIHEINEGIALCGIDAELRHLALEMGVSEEEVWARYEEARREIEAEERRFRARLQRPQARQRPPESAITIEG